MSSKPYTPLQERLLSGVLKGMSPVNTAVYRISSGKVGGRFSRRAPICLLTTTGRRSGQPRTVPLLYLADGDDVVLVASKGGMAHHPAWYLNLADNPEVTVQIGRTTTRMVARTATPEEKGPLWQRLVAMYKSYDSYQARTERDIPVVICTPAS
ncbi:MAG: nitroreductase family deazaflavin-dependent oxidoreductase [Actinobacteria bacterium]|nr:nitroreductase family deazaflavin-dependent oxidoreductase [Actinomycetota bacterium]